MADLDDGIKMAKRFSVPINRIGMSLYPGKVVPDEGCGALDWGVQSHLWMFEIRKQVKP